MIATKRTIRALIVFTVLIIVFLIYSGLAAGCSGQDNGSEINQNGEPGELTILKNKILVGTDALYPPFEFVQDGTVDGFDIDIAQEIAARLEKEMEIVPINWDFTYKIPEDVRLDMIISAISAAEDREEFVDFSDPYYIMEYVFMVLSDAELKIREDLKGKKIGMVGHEVKDLSPEYLKDYTIEEYKCVLLMLEELRSKNIDGVLISIPVGKNIIEKNNGIYRVLEVVKSERTFNIVFHEGSPLRDEVNRILSEMAEDGIYQQIYDKWFSFSAE